MRAVAQNRFVLGLVLGAILVLRALIPSGWMPSSVDGRWIVLCSAQGSTSVWVDAAGKIHKDDVPGKSKADGPCAFAGLGLGFDLVQIAQPPPPFWIVPALVVIAFPPSAVGQGLAAPPPPKTGPPLLI